MGVPYCEPNESVKNHLQLRRLSIFLDLVSRVIKRPDAPASMAGPDLKTISGPLLLRIYEKQLWQVENGQALFR
jgi:hypothetical protein